MRTRLDHLKQIINRLQKEIAYYTKEIAADNERIKDLHCEEDCEEKDYKIRKYTEVAQENHVAMHECQRMLAEYIMERDEILEAEREENAEMKEKTYH